ncbi:MAG: hypothetical protein WCF65_02425 [Parachlamydiaceae bacterium]
MEEKHPYEELFDEIGKLLKFLREHSDVPLDHIKAPENSGASMDAVKKQMDAFNRLGNLVITLSGVSKDELNMRLMGISSQMTPEAKRIIDKGNAIKKEIESLKEKFDKATKTIPLEPEAVGEPSEESSERTLTEKQQAQKRRGKFKPFGGNDKWKLM